MSAEALMYEYMMRTGGVPPNAAEVIELDQLIGHKFEFRPDFDPAPARFWLGLNGAVPRNVSKEERLRLANMLRRAEKISDEELAGLGMIAKPIQDELTRVRDNQRWNQQYRSGYDPLPFRNRTDW